MRHHFQLRYTGLAIPRGHVRNRTFIPVPVFHLTSSSMSLLSLAAVAIVHPFPSTAMYSFSLWPVLSPFLYMSSVCRPFQVPALHTTTTAALVPTLFDFAVTNTLLSSQLPTGMNNASVEFICIPGIYCSKDVYKPSCSLRGPRHQHESTHFVFSIS